MSEHANGEACRDLSYEDITVGETASFSVVVDAPLVDGFGELVGDKNPLHMDEAYASGTKFGGRVAHGMIIGGLFSRLIGMQLPGKRALYLSQTLNFRRPVILGTELTIRGEVTQKSDVSHTIIMDMSAVDAQKNVVASGEAMVQILSN